RYADGSDHCGDLWRRLGCDVSFALGRAPRPGRGTGRVARSAARASPRGCGQPASVIPNYRKLEAHSAELLSGISSTRRRELPAHFQSVSSPLRGARATVPGLATTVPVATRRPVVWLRT